MSFLLGLPIFWGYVKFPGCTLSETNIAAEYGPGPKRKCHLQTIHFQCVMLLFREGNPNVFESCKYARDVMCSAMYKYYVCNM